MMIASFVLVFLSGMRGASSFQFFHVVPLISERTNCWSKDRGCARLVRNSLTVHTSPLRSSPVAGEATWSVEDDWWRLSEAENTVPLPVPGEDVARVAAVAMDQPIDEALSEDDQFIYDSVDTINDSPLDSESPQRAIYDAPGDVIQVTTEDLMGLEIAMLVRCNESPKEMLIAEGRALPPLTDEERDDVSQLATMNDNAWEITDFFRNAIRGMYEQHMNSDGAMKAAGVASWMSKSLNSHVSAHDKRVLATITRFGEYGTGCLKAEAFEEIYVAALNVALKRPNPGTSSRIGIKEKHSVSTIWRDIRNHNILSPVEVEREMKMLEIRKRIGDAQEAEYTGLSGVMDECEILDMGQTFATTTYQTAWADVKEKEFSSHELLEMAADGKTPLHLRDGDFIFIDEESCIGCMQCATTAPSSFLMLDHGRARTFEQRNDPDVAAAVTTCPVSCMHRVSFDELKELEIAREKGDGRTDHRHCGSSKGYTPLHVARRGTDANKKDSWYHYLKQKCYCT